MTEWHNDTKQIISEMFFSWLSTEKLNQTQLEMRGKA